MIITPLKDIKTYVDNVVGGNAINCIENGILSSFCIVFLFNEIPLVMRNVSINDISININNIINLLSYMMC